MKIIDWNVYNFIKKDLTEDQKKDIKSYFWLRLIARVLFIGSIILAWYFFNYKLAIVLFTLGLALLFVFRALLIELNQIQFDIRRLASMVTSLSTKGSEQETESLDT